MVQQEVIGTQMGKLKKEVKALMSICRGAAGGHAWFEGSGKKPWLTTVKKLIADLDKKSSCIITMST